MDVRAALASARWLLPFSVVALVNGCSKAGGSDGSASRQGPFASKGRANQEAAKYRAQGWRAVAFHYGDGYSLDVRR